MEEQLNVPDKYKKYFGSLESEPGLIDDCKYMLYFAPGYAYMGEYPCMPVRSKREALDLIKQADPEKGYDEKLAQGIVSPRRDDYEEEV